MRNILGVGKKIFSIKKPSVHLCYSVSKCSVAKPIHMVRERQSVELAILYFFASVNEMTIEAITRFI